MTRVSERHVSARVDELTEVRARERQWTRRYGNGTATYADVLCIREELANLELALAIVRFA